MGCISRVCCYMDLKGSELCFLRFHPLKTSLTISIKIAKRTPTLSIPKKPQKTKTTTTATAKPLLAYSFLWPQRFGQSLYETGAYLPHSWDLLIPCVQAMGSAETPGQKVWRSGQVQTGLPHITDLTISQLFSSQRLLVLGGWPLFYIFPISISVAPSISYNGLRPDRRKIVFWIVIKWCPRGKRGDIAPPSVKTDSGHKVYSLQQK